MKKASNFIEKIQSWFSMALFVVFLICIVLQILSRYIPFIKVIGTEEIATYSFIWAILMGAAVELKRKEHFAFEFVRANAKGTLHLVLETAIYGLVIAFSLYIALSGVQLTRQFWNWNLTSFNFISQRYIWSSLIVCGATMAFYGLCNLVLVYQNYNKEKEK